MLTTLVVLHRALSFTKIPMSDLFLKGGEGAEHLLGTGGKTDPVDMSVRNTVLILWKASNVIGGSLIRGTAP